MDLEPTVPCPKCEFNSGGMPSFKKPRYQPWELGTSECLIYECVNCGFEQRIVTKDYRTPEQLAKQIEEEKRKLGTFETERE